MAGMGKVVLQEEACLLKIQPETQSRLIRFKWVTNPNKE
jgi:hypothetical protein